MDRILSLAVTRQRRKPSLIDIASLGYSPAIHGFNRLDPLVECPVPNFQGVPEACRRGEKAARLGEDGVAGDEKLSSAVALHLDVEIYFEGGL